MKITFLFAVVCLLLLSSCVQERLEPLSAEMKSQLALLPQEADLLGYINLEQIRQSAVSKVIMDSAEFHAFHHKEFDELKTATGFDFRKDAKNIYFAAALNKDEKGMNGIFLANGNFDPDKIINFINSKNENKKVTAEPYQRFNIYRLAEEQSVFCFPNSQTLIGGKETAVKTCLDKFEQSTEIKISPVWLQRIETLKYKSGIWLVMSTENFIEVMNQNIPLPKNFQGIKNIKNSSLSMDFSERLSFYGQGECLDPEKAVLFSDAIKGFLAAAKLAFSEERDLVDIINQVKVESKNEKVTVHFKLKAEEIEKLMQKRKSFSRSI